MCVPWRLLQFVISVFKKFCFDFNFSSFIFFFMNLFGCWLLGGQLRADFLLFLFTFIDRADVLPLITTCNQIVSKFLNYGSGLLWLNRLFIDCNNYSWWKDKKKRREEVIIGSMWQLWCMKWEKNCGIKRFRDEDSLCFRAGIH